MEERNHTDKVFKKQSISSIACKTSDIVKTVMPRMNLNDDIERSAFMEALKRFSVTESELEQGFWDAYADHFTPQTGIEFRHIYKHIQELREKKSENSVNINMDRFI